MHQADEVSTLQGRRVSSETKFLSVASMIRAPGRCLGEGRSASTRFSLIC